MTQPGWPRGIAAITLFVEDLQAATDFYQRTFQLPLAFSDDDSAVFRFGATLVNLLQAAAAEELLAPATIAAADSGARSLLTVQVKDVDEMCEQLTARGVRLLNGPIDRPWGVRTASFRDPDGHLWEIAT
mgnify:CR=1 FL=1